MISFRYSWGKYLFMASADILTGQFVSIEQIPASIGDRIVARIIDNVIKVLSFIVIFVVLSQVPYDDLAGFFAVVFVILLLLYTFLFELFFNGQTVGKMIMKIRTVKADGSSPTMGSLFLRWLLEIIDINVFFIGILPIMVTKRHQRIGDLAAGTMVVCCPDMSQMHISLSGIISEYQYALPDYKPEYPEAYLLTPGQVELIERVVKSGEANAYANAQAISRLADKVAKAVHARGGFFGYPFLCRVLRDYRYFEMNRV